MSKLKNDDNAKPENSGNKLVEDLEAGKKMEVDNSDCDCESKNDYESKKVLSPQEVSFYAQKYGTMMSFCLQMLDSTESVILAADSKDDQELAAKVSTFRGETREYLMNELLSGYNKLKTILN